MKRHLRPSQCNAWILITGIVWLLSANTANADTLCRIGDIERRIGIDYANPPSKVPCQVRYLKVNINDLSFPWRAERELGYCEARAEALIEKFKSLGWSCEAIGGDRSERQETVTTEE